VTRPTVLASVLATVEVHPWATAPEIASHYTGPAASPAVLAATLSSAWTAGHVARCGPIGAYRYSVECVPQTVEGIRALLDRIHGDRWYLHSYEPPAGHVAAYAVALNGRGQPTILATTAIYSSAYDALHAGLSLAPAVAP